MKYLSLLLCISSHIAIAAEADIKGFRIGMTVDEVKAMAVGISCRLESIEIDQCSYFPRIERHNIPSLNSVAEKQAEGWIFEFSQSRLDRVTVAIARSAYESVLSAVVDKHGRPARTEHRILESNFGRRVKSVDSIWVKRGATLYMLEYYGDIDTSAIGLFSTTYESNRNRRDKLDSKRRGRDL